MTNKSAAWTAIIVMLLIIAALSTRLMLISEAQGPFDPASCADNPETCQDYQNLP